MVIFAIIIIKPISADVILNGQASWVTGNITYYGNFTKLNVTKLSITGTGFKAQDLPTDPYRFYNFSSILNPQMIIQLKKINHYETDFYHLTPSSTDLKGGANGSQLAGLAIDFLSSTHSWNGAFNSFSAGTGRYIQEMWKAGVDGVTSLHYHSIGNDFIQLEWFQPALNGQLLHGYQINYTTPYGNPKTIIVNDTANSLTTYTVSGLTQNTPYSFRLAFYGNGSANYTGNVLDVTTLTFAPFNYTSGNLTITLTNNNTAPISFERTEINSTATQIKVTHPTSYNMSYAFQFAFENTSKTYTGVTETPIIGTNNSYASFIIRNATDDLTQINATDRNSGINGIYKITQNATMPFVQQIDDFRAGKFGTKGLFGTLDFISLVAIIISMVGLNRVNESVGAVFTLMLMGGLAFFHIITLPTYIFAAIAVVLVLSVVTTRKLPYT